MRSLPVVSLPAFGKCLLKTLLIPSTMILIFFERFYPRHRKDVFGMNEPLKLRRAVVNGALGAVGQALVRALLDRGVETWALCYPTDPRICHLPSKAHIIKLDMRDVERLPELIPGGADAFFHLAWMGTIGPNRDNALIQTENIRCAVLAAETAKALGCGVFVGAGSQAEHGRIEGLVTADAPCFPTTGYGIAKLCAGQLTRLACSRLELRHVWARILSAYGPGGDTLSVIPTMLAKLTRGEKPSLTAGEQQWDFCYTSDVAEALICMAESGRPGAVYPVGYGKTRMLREYFEVIRDAVDPSLPLGIGELPYPPNQVMHLQADLTSLREDTGFEPKVPFEEGIRLTLEAYRNGN